MTVRAKFLRHTRERAANGLYCGDSDAMQGLVSMGLMVSAGRKGFVPDEYFRMTNKGADTLREIENTIYTEATGRQ